jgi:Protein of unknown function (DUF559)
VVARRQLGAMGWSPRAIDWRVTTGRLHVIHRGVYAVGHRVLSANGHRMAAALACGPGAVVSHRSAAALWEIWRTARARIDVTTTNQAGRGRSRIDIHRARHLDPADVTTHHAIPTTTVARTLVDLADVLHPRALKKAIHESEVLRLLDVTEVKEAIARANGKHRTRLLSDLLEHAYAKDELTESELEDAFLDLCERADVQTPESQVELSVGEQHFRVDFLWPARRLVVEVDGHATHGTRRGFEEDRRRDVGLVAAGYRVVRFTWRQIESERAEVVARLRAILGDR